MPDGLESMYQVGFVLHTPLRKKGNDKSNPVFKTFLYTKQRLDSWEYGDVISKFARGKSCIVLIWPLDGWGCSQMVRCPCPAGSNPVTYCKDGKMTDCSHLLSSYFLSLIWLHFLVWPFMYHLFCLLIDSPSVRHSPSVHHPPSVRHSPSVCHSPFVYHLPSVIH